MVPPRLVVIVTAVTYHLVGFRVIGPRGPVIERKAGTFLNCTSGTTMKWHERNALALDPRQMTNNSFVLKEIAAMRRIQS